MADMPIIVLFYIENEMHNKPQGLLLSTVDFVFQTLFYTEQPRLRYLFQVVQTQTTAAYCRILPTLDHHV